MESLKKEPENMKKYAQGPSKMVRSAVAPPLRKSFHIAAEGAARGSCSDGGGAGTQGY